LFDGQIKIQQEVKTNMSRIINEKEIDVNKKIDKIVNDVKSIFTESKIKNVNISYKFPNNHPERKKLIECSKNLFTTILQHQQTKDIKKNVTFMSCKSKFCPICNQIKSKKWAKALYDRVGILQEEGQRFAFLTLTIKNIEIVKLSKTIELMNRSWRDFWRRYLSKRFNGFVKILEITFPNEKEAHPHFHILLSTDRSYFFKTNKDYLSTEQIAKLWGRVLKVDYIPVVDIRIIKPKKVAGGYISKEAIPAVIAEMTKYPMKDTDYNKLNSMTMAILYEQLYRKRLIATGGNLKISINGDLSITEIKEDYEEWKEIAFIVLKYIQNEYIIANGDLNK